MPKRLSKKAGRRGAHTPDANEQAFQAVQRVQAISEGLGALLDDDVHRRQIMREMGSRGGKKGGKRRLETMTPEARKAAASVAAKARWAKKPGQS